MIDSNKRRFKGSLFGHKRPWWIY